MSRPRKKLTPGKLRIVAGSLRGSRLPIPDVPGLRPTPDRVRETLFNWLAPVIAGVHCLDLFAGTGALGIEALSRGAAHVDFVERDPRLATQLRENLARLGQTGGTVFSGDALNTLADLTAPYHVVFLDPPFDAGLWEAVANAMEMHHMFAASAWIYVESPLQAQILLPAIWILHRQANAGAVRYALYRREPTIR